MTAGILSSRRMRRAAPLPNSVRDSAVIFSVAMVVLLWVSGSGASTRSRRHPARGEHRVWSARPVDHGVPAGGRTPSPRQPEQFTDAPPDQRISENREEVEGLGIDRAPARAMRAVSKS